MLPYQKGPLIKFNILCTTYFQAFNPFSKCYSNNWCGTLSHLAIYIKKDVKAKEEL